MTEQSSSPGGEPPSPETVRRSLRALATSTAGTSPPPSASSLDEQRPDRAASEGAVCEAEETGDSERLVRHPEGVIRDAERAVSSAAAAAAYLAAGRLATLTAAIDAADRRDATELAARGRDARATLRRLEVALDGEADDPEVGSDRPTTAVSLP